MWFRNLYLFKFTEEFTLNAETLEQELQRFEFAPCGVHEASSHGWASPMEAPDAPLVYSANGILGIALKTEDKLLPSSVVNSEVQERVIAFEEANQRKMRKKEKLELKEDIYNHLLPRAFTKSALLHAYIDTISGYLLVNTSSAKKAELFTEKLRNTLGSLKIQLPETQSVPALLTDWLVNHNLPEDFDLQGTCTLTDGQDGGTIKCQKQNLLGDDIQTLLDGRMVNQLALVWKEHVSFALTEAFNIKSIKYLDLIQEQAKDTHAETALEKFDANFTLMALTLRELIEALMKVFAKQ